MSSPPKRTVQINAIRFDLQCLIVSSSNTDVCSKFHLHTPVPFSRYRLNHLPQFRTYVLQSPPYRRTPKFPPTDFIPNLNRLPTLQALTSCLILQTPSTQTVLVFFPVYLPRRWLHLPGKSEQILRASLVRKRQRFQFLFKSRPFRMSYTNNNHQVLSSPQNHL